MYASYTPFEEDTHDTAEYLAECVRVREIVERDAQVHVGNHGNACKTILKEAKEQLKNETDD